jgi:phospholipid/cholesterol/gamma-HCH transport system substrate-binding protein
MDERIVKFRVGVMVLATLLITATLVLLFADPSTILRGSYVVHIRFQDAPGIGESTPVRNRGIHVGRVTKVDFDEHGDVLVSVAIDANRTLRHDEVPRIRTSLLGDSMIQFVKAEDETLPKVPIKPGETIEGATVSDPLKLLSNLEPQLNEMIRSVTRTSNELGKMTQQINRLLDTNDDQLSQVLNKTQRALDSITQAMTNADQLLGDPQFRNNLKRGVEELPLVLKDSRQAITGLHNTLQLADRNLQNLEGFTRPLGERGEQMFDKLDRSAGKLELMLDRLVIFSDTLNRREGTLGRLTSDSELYDNLNAAAKNVECLTRELRPILNDVRVFTDKVSRDPGRIGVRGVFQQNSGIK